MRVLVLVSGFLSALAHAAIANADAFGSGANLFEIEFVTIGNPGNPADDTGLPSGRGSVAYSYRIGKYETSNDMIDKANKLAPLLINHTSNSAEVDDAVWNIDFFEATRFVNWLNTSTGHHPAYKYNGSLLEIWQSGDAGYNPSNPIRNSLAKYFIPSNDEWYKAAYYDAATGTYFDYPTGSNSPPTPIESGTAPGTARYDRPQQFWPPSDIYLAGGLSPYGTMAQGGNAYELLETEEDGINNDIMAGRLYRGGSANLPSANAFQLSSTHYLISRGPGGQDIPYGGATESSGLRVASRVPEPA